MTKNKEAGAIILVMAVVLFLAAGVSQAEAKAAIVKKAGVTATVKNQNGKRLKGIVCGIETANKSNSMMVQVKSKKTNSKGKCSIKKLDASKSYVLRVYWTKDKSRVSMMSLGTIPAGTTATRVVVKPAAY